VKNYYKNEYLFSEIYLQEITQVKEDPTVKATLTTLKEYRDYADTSSLEAWNLSFVHEILNALRFGVQKIDDNTVLLYQLGSDATTALCFSLLPSEDLDSTTMGRNWSEKLIRNIRNNHLKWGILTNGDHWRIYHSEEPTPYENYLEIDLKGIMDSEDVPQYQIFNKFMKSENFIPDKDGNCQFDIFKKESQDRINYIEEELKNALKQKEEGGKGILSNICMGYVDYLRKNEDIDLSDEGLRDTIYAGAMLYMFRLLFVFYANARKLLKESNYQIFSNVLEAAQKNHEQSEIETDGYLLWNNLRELFSNIDLTYNGGLFNPAENEFVEEKRLSNNYLASVIYYMTFYENKAGVQQLISYRDMGVRHLGSLYEGLLEHKLFIAEEDTEVKVTNNEVKFIPISEGGKVVEGRYIPTGQVYFGNDKGMRKATGSYYTPEYVVDYIVQNTVGKKLEELREDFSKKTKDTIDSIETAINDNEKAAFTELLSINIDEFIQENILKLSVLDMAMGSGHFMVNTTNHISNFLTEFTNDFNIFADQDTSTTFWRRRVVENCIYGVDVNPLAVELAKLSLWILSMAKDKPLSFLDHHLKYGNSLIGAKLAEIGHYPNKVENIRISSSQLGLFENNKNFEEAVTEAVTKYKQIECWQSIKLENIGEKKQWLDEINEILKVYKLICDFHTSIYFGNGFSKDHYDKIISEFDNNFECNVDPFFHWELEFPEIILEEGGFDIVIGNPPWGGDLCPEEKNFISKYFQTFLGNFDSYLFFIEKSARIAGKKSLISLITPDTWIRAPQSIKLREYVLTEFHLESITTMPVKVFKDVSANCIVFMFGKDNNIESGCLIHLMQFDADLSDLKNQNFIKNYIVDSALWEKSDDLQFQIYQKTEIAYLIKKIQSRSSKAIESLDVMQGIVPYSKAHHSKEIVEKRLFHSPNRITEEYGPWIKGKNVSRYYLHQDVKEYLKYGDWLHRRRKKKYFQGERILIQEITGGNPPRISACFCDQNLYHDPGIISCLNKGKYHILFLLGIINSSFISWYHRYNSPKGKRVTFPKILIGDIRGLPIPNLDLDHGNDKVIHDKLVHLVRGYVKELKTVISSKSDLDRQSSQISLAQFENKIDNIVFDLYGLTHDEIKIIEEER